MHKPEITLRKAFVARAGICLRGRVWIEIVIIPDQIGSIQKRRRRAEDVGFAEKVRAADLPTGDDGAWRLNLIPFDAPILRIRASTANPHFSPQPRMVSRRVICELIQHVTEPVRYKRTHTKNTLFFRSQSADSW